MLMSMNINFEKQVQITSVAGTILMLLFLPAALESRYYDVQTDNGAAGLSLILGIILLLFGAWNLRHLKRTGRLVLLTSMGIAVSALFLICLKESSKLTGSW